MNMDKVEQHIALQEAVEFLWKEAEILDRVDYPAWLDLWSEDGHYVVPGDPAVEDYAAHLNIAYDDAEMRRMRVQRLEGGFAISAAPPARTVRLQSRFVVKDSSPDRLTLTCAQLLVEDKFGRQRSFPADVTYVLVRGESGLRIRDKVVRLLNCDGMLTSISYLF